MTWSTCAVILLLNIYMYSLFNDGSVQTYLPLPLNKHNTVDFSNAKNMERTVILPPHRKQVNASVQTATFLSKYISERMIAVDNVHRSSDDTSNKSENHHQHTAAGNTTVPLQIQHSQHPEQHVMPINESSNRFRESREPDWYGFSSPHYLYAYSAFYINKSLYMNNSVVTILLVPKSVTTLYCLFKHLDMQWTVKGHLYQMSYCIHGTCTSCLWCPLPHNITQLPMKVGISLNANINSSFVAKIPIENC